MGQVHSDPIRTDLKKLNVPRVYHPDQVLMIGNRKMDVGLFSKNLSEGS